MIQVNDLSIHQLTILLIILLNAYTQPIYREVCGASTYVHPDYEERPY